MAESSFPFRMRMFDRLSPGARIRGLTPAGVAEIVQVSRFGADALNIVFRADGKVGERLLYRGEESALEFVEAGQAYTFNADDDLLRLASQASRIRLAQFFDPYLAVSASQIDAMHHQITAVYAEMSLPVEFRFSRICRAVVAGSCGMQDACTSGQYQTTSGTHPACCLKSHCYRALPCRHSRSFR